MRKSWILAIAGLLQACSGNNTENEYSHSVYVTTPQLTDIGCSKTFSGTVEEAHSISLGFKTAGQLARIHVKDGDYVTRGQLLAELDDTDYRLGVDALQIQYDQLHDEVERATSLFEKKSMSANDYEKASAGLRQIGVQLQANKNKLAYTKLYAPASGYISSVNFSQAEMVDAGTAVFTLLDISRMEVVADIPATTYLRRSDFCGFTCSTSHIDGVQFPMALVSIIPKADGNQLYRLKLAFKNDADKRFTPGMNVEVGISMQSDSINSMRIPLSALFRKDNEDCVWILNSDSTVVSRPVVIERSASSADAVVSSGLSATDIIVRAGVGMLREGEKVRVIEQASETNVGGLL